jgi:putative ABC transport system permease protein
VMLTKAYFENHFGADSSLIGKHLRIGGRQAEVVGVLEPAPFFPQRIDALMNMSISEHHVSALMQDGRSHRMTEMIARLAPDASVEQARAEVAAITSRVHQQYPEQYDAGSGYKITLTPFHEILGQDAKLTLWLLMGAAAFVLIIAIANVGNLTLMRGIRREHEMTVRAALGAGTTRLRKLLLAENLVLALAGAGLGLVIAYGGVDLLTSFIGRYSPRADEIRVDGIVLAFTLVLAVLVAVLLAFAPSIGNEGSLGAGLVSSGTRSSGGVRRRRLQRALVVTQVAVSVVLLAGAGLLVRSMQALAAVDPGLDATNVLTMEVPVDFTSPDDLNGAVQRYQRMSQELSTLPGVNVVGLGSTMPLRKAGFQLPIKAEGKVIEQGQAQPISEFRTADAGYFRASGIRIASGRDFTPNDDARAPKVVILNQLAADRLFPNEDPIGRRVTWTGDILKFIGMQETWMTVVGVVPNTKDGGLDAEPVPVTFMPFEQGPFPGGGVVVRADVDPQGISNAVRAIVRSIAPRQPIENVMTVDAIRDESVGPRRLNAMLVGSFGVLAAALAAIGIAAVMAFAVSARTNEIGIRMSLGADAASVQRMFVGEGFRLVATGLVIGVIGAVALSRLIQGLLFGVQPNDPVTLVAVGILMLATGVIACWVPATRAARVDPANMLRAQ